MKTALELLKLATEKWPPSDGMRHNLTTQDGVLTLYIAQPDKTWRSVNFDGEGDLDKDAATSIQEIASLLDSATV